MAKRTPITATGAELMGMIAAAEGGSLMLTQAEGADLVNNGFATVDTSKTEGDTAAVSLTDAGKASLNPPEAGAPAAPSGSAKFNIRTDVAMPETTTRRGRSGGYPFDALPIGGSFHVAATDKEPNPTTKLASSVSGANAKFAKPTGENKTVTVKTYERGDDGKFVKDADGKRVVASTSEETRPVMANTKTFEVRTVDASDPDGKGARVFRTA